MKKQLWETRPLKSWAKAKEMRAKFEQSVGDAQKEHILLAQTGLWSIWTFAMPAIRPVEDNPIGAMMQFQDSKFSRECRLATETAGWGREVCGYQLNCWGAMYLDRQIDGSNSPCAISWYRSPTLATSIPSAASARWTRHPSPAGRPTGRSTRGPTTRYGKRR